MADTIITICLIALGLMGLLSIYKLGFKHGAKAALIFVEIKKREEKRNQKRSAFDNKGQRNG